MVTRRILPLAAIGVGLAAACQIALGIERVDKESASGSNDGGADVVLPDPDPCRHAVRPPRPVNDDPAASPPGPIYFAVQNLGIQGFDDAGAPLGFDLDGVCTCDTRPATNEGGAPSCRSSKTICDDDAGVDNASSHLFQSFATPGLNIDDAAGLNRDILQGTRGVILYLSDYNGEANDISVEGGLYLSYGILEKDGCNNAPSDDVPGKFKPSFCGKDKWSFNPTQTFKAPDGKPLPLLKGKGWVTNFQLVFEGQVAFQLFLGSSVVRLGTPLQVGTLTKVKKGTDTLWHLDGILGGRIPARDLLVAVGTLKVPGFDARFCDQPLLFGSVKDNLCAALDIPSSNEFDFRGGGCDAISSAVTFSAEQSGVGTVSRDETPDGGGCPNTDTPAYDCP